MYNIQILGSGSSLPKKKLDNIFFEKTVNKSDEWIYSKTGIKTRYIIENIQEYIAENGKITYNVRQTEEIHEIISDYVNERVSLYVYDMPQGWLELKDNGQNYKPGEFHIYSIMKCLENTIIKYVFQQYGDGYEFIDNQEEDQAHNSGEDASEDANQDESKITDYDEVKQKNECIIN